MNIQFTANKQEFDMEINEAVEKLLASTSNEIKTSGENIPQKLAQKILTNEGINFDIINSKFHGYCYAAKYMVMRYCFDKLNEDNRYLGVIEVESNFYSKLSKGKLINNVGEDNYNKYYKLINFVKNTDIDELNCSENEIKIFEKIFDFLTAYNNKYYNKYLLFAQKFNLIAEIPFFRLYEMVKENSLTVYKYLSSVIMEEKIEIFKKAVNFETYKNGFIEFYNYYNDNSFNEFLTLNNI